MITDAEIRRLRELCAAEPEPGAGPRDFVNEWLRLDREVARQTRAVLPRLLDELERLRGEVERSCAREKHWRECFIALQTAIVGDSGLSAIEEVARMKRRIVHFEAREAELIRAVSARDRALSDDAHEQVPYVAGPEGEG